VLKRINKLIADASRSPQAGIGKPEPLKYGLAGAWSRRITEEHRLAYRVVGDDLQILKPDITTAKRGSCFFTAAARQGGPPGSSAIGAVIGTVRPPKRELIIYEQITVHSCVACCS
jgi:Txe/YoeB family toxin of toxin-antitoxin system